MPVLAAEPAQPKPLLQQAEAAFTNGNRPEAIALATAAIKADPKSAEAFALRGRFHAESHDSTKAIADFDEVLKLDQIGRAHV